MFINTRKDSIHRATLSLFFFFLFAQSFISYKALRKQQFGPVHIYVSDQTVGRSRYLISDESELSNNTNDTAGDRFPKTGREIFPQTTSTDSVSSVTRHNVRNPRIQYRKRKTKLLTGFKDDPDQNKELLLSLSRVNSASPLKTPLSEDYVNRKESNPTEFGMLGGYFKQDIARKMPPINMNTEADSPHLAYVNALRTGLSLGAVDEQIAKEEQSLDKIRELERRLQNTLTETRPHCPSVPSDLSGRIKMTLKPVPLDLLKPQLPNVTAGGRWHPSQCRANHHIAIIIPYRDRPAHLRILLSNLHPLLQKQQLAYGIFVIEMSQPTSFNRGLLMNIGYKEAKRFEDFQCYIFHDVDLIPEDDRNLYICPEPARPRHMSVAVSTMHYRLPYANIFGGVSAMSKEQFEKVNGFSNLYFGWGGEDDDLSYRIRFHGYNITRYSADIARYTMLKHTQESKNPTRMRLLSEARRRIGVDGLNTLKYRLLKVELRDLYTWIFVDIPSGGINEEIRG